MRRFIGKVTPEVTAEDSGEAGKSVSVAGDCCGHLSVRLPTEGKEARCHVLSTCALHQMRAAPEKPTTFACFLSL